MEGLRILAQFQLDILLGSIPALGTGKSWVVSNFTGLRREQSAKMGTTTTVKQQVFGSRRPDAYYR